MYTKTAMTDTFFCLFLSMNIYAEKAPSAGKYMQTRVRRRCLDRVFYGLMHRYVEPGARARLHDFTRERSHEPSYNLLFFYYLSKIFKIFIVLANTSPLYCPGLETGPDPAVVGIVLVPPGPTCAVVSLDADVVDEAGPSPRTVDAGGSSDVPPEVE